MTERHRFYLILASLFGLLVGAISGVLVAVVIGVILAGSGCTVLAALKKVYGEKWGDSLWVATAVGAIITGVMFILGAVVFLVLHEAEMV